jgi:hypothetical protein
MQAGERTRRNWAIALAASALIHVLVVGFVRFAPVPSAEEAVDATPIAILRITKRARNAHGGHGGAAAAPSVSHANPYRTAAATTTAAARPAGATAARARTHAAMPVEVGASSATRSAGAKATDESASPPGPEESPGPAPTITAEMLAALNQRIRDAIPNAPPQTTKLYPMDMRGLAVRPDPNRWTVANYPLPQRGLFVHAIIVRVGREAVAVRAIQRVGHAYICIGYLAKIDEHNPDATLAGPFVGPCKKAWREQLGLAPKPSPSPSSDATTAPSAGPSPSTSPLPLG